MEDFNIWIALGLFVTYLLVDALYAVYTITVVKRRALAAANVSFLMHFLLAVASVELRE